MGFSVLLAPVALILSVVGLFWKESRVLSLIGLLLSVIPTAVLVMRFV